MSEPSCSDCKIELIEKQWIKLLLKWINKCVYKSTMKIKKLNAQCLADIMAKYNRDVCADDIDRAMLCTDDVEPFINYKYPILRLQYLSELSDIPKKLYIMTSMVLYHCCMSSRTGAVDGDICRELAKYEQELIIKFCENLFDMEATVHNVERAIKNAFEAVGLKETAEISSDKFDVSVSSDTEAQATSDPTSKDSVMSLASDDTLVPEAPSITLQTMQFKSITLLPSVMAETSSYSDLMTESDDMVMMEKDAYVDSDDFNVLYAMEKKDNKKNKEKRDESSKNESKKETIKKDTIKNDTLEEEAPAEKPKKSRKVTHHEENAAIEQAISKHKLSDKEANEIKEDVTQKKAGEQEKTSEVVKKNSRCLSECACSRCSASGPCCGDFGSTMGICKPDEEEKKKKPWNFFFSKCKTPSKSMKVYMMAVAVLLLAILVVVCSTVPFIQSNNRVMQKSQVIQFAEKNIRPMEGHVWECKEGLCHKAYVTDENTFSSYSRCTLICMGPQLWPQPIGYTFYSKKIVALSTSKLEYKFQSIPSELVHQYLSEAFKNFIGNLARLEKTSGKQKNKTLDLVMCKMSIQIDVESDSEPRLRLNTEEAYHLKIKAIGKKVVIIVSSASFCGVRHGLETLSQMILLDQTTGKLITLSSAVVKDAPSYKYRGVMIDTARNFIPVTDLMRTVDAMATVKLNTFHWRISDVTSFPLLLETLPELFEYGAYDRSLVYTKEDVVALVNRASFRGIRVLIEVAAPGPVGRPWSWSPDVSCPTKNDNFTCDNILCLRMNMKDAIFDALRIIYTEILEMTKVDDIIHLSNGVFSFANCYSLIEDRDGFLDKALAVLQQANKGFLPKLPVVWYTHHLTKDYEAKTWERLGVQLNEIEQDSDDNYLSKFKVIHSSKWDLSCMMKKHRCMKYRTWQEMYAWKSWRNIEVFTIEGGEAVLWTDLVNSGNLDSHLWPRAAAVAERLWSDTAANATSTGPVYVRLDSQRWRMLFHGINVQPVWPVWCSFNPGVCLEKLHTHRK